MPKKAADRTAGTMVVPPKRSPNRSSEDRKRTSSAVTAAGTSAQPARWTHGAAVFIALRKPHRASSEHSTASSSSKESSTKSARPPRRLDCRARQARRTLTLAMNTERKMTPMLQQSGITTSTAG
jgi:hypothetical protein